MSLIIIYIVLFCELYFGVGIKLAIPMSFAVVNIMVNFLIYVLL